MPNQQDISEFSYGFALTESLINWEGVDLTAAPVFPSLLAEGGAGGGYDVRLDRAGAVALLLQFKLTRRVTSRRAQEVRKGLLNVPLFRFPVYGSNRSNQHVMLLEQEANGFDVFYVAPSFVTNRALNEHFSTGKVAVNSAWFRPSSIGQLPDAKDHHISFRGSGGTGWVLSDPYPIKEALDADSVSGYLLRALEVHRGRPPDLESLLDSLSESVRLHEPQGLFAIADHEPFERLSTARRAAYIAQILWAVRCIW